jgi:hypothetical protein
MVHARSSFWAGGVRRVLAGWPVPGDEAPGFVPVVASHRDETARPASDAAGSIEVELRGIMVRAWLRLPSDERLGRESRRSTGSSQSAPKIGCSPPWRCRAWNGW